jgi:hypothetical protein
MPGFRSTWTPPDDSKSPWKDEKLVVQLEMPDNLAFIAATAARVNLKAKTTDPKYNTLNITVQIFQSDGTTPVTTQQTVWGSLSTELASYASSLELQGRQELAQWGAPRLTVIRSNYCIEIVELSATIDYLVPAPPSPDDSK